MPHARKGPRQGEAVCARAPPADKVSEYLTACPRCGSPSGRGRPIWGTSTIRVHVQPTCAQFVLSPLSRSPPMVPRMVGAHQAVCPEHSRHAVIMCSSAHALGQSFRDTIPGPKALSRPCQHGTTSDNGHYGAHGLALLQEIRTWCGVRAGYCRKKSSILLYI